MNSFLALQEQELTAFTEARQVRVRQRVERELKSAEFIGSLIELFGPVMADTVNVLGGGDPLVQDETYLLLQESEDDDPYGSPPPGPGDSGQIIR
ncbi:hypothetical protein GGR28_002231 [Lewinella aquimaris]|uniref:Uncharacterized protein n=1 Tax=Neolewinella aquimaris TaxID=1835722 RepID=A0A840EF99_9BACT|nr:hypothetical protein [Neolewinella aquimaris]MBB4079606.1 hypothetical protein [Neolewinella aquimaris]